VGKATFTVAGAVSELLAVINTQQQRTEFPLNLNLGFSPSSDTSGAQVTGWRQESQAASADLPIKLKQHCQQLPHNAFMRLVALWRWARAGPV
jgi:hypothetical protein